jgi:hypothetical protein
MYRKCWTRYNISMAYRYRPKQWWKKSKRSRGSLNGGQWMKKMKAEGRWTEAHEEKYRKHVNNSLRKRQQARRKYIDALKLSRGCADCGYNAHAAALDFDHLPGTEKKFNIANYVWLMGKGSDLEAEIAKCEVVCSNCHRVRTSKRLKENGVARRKVAESLPASSAAMPKNGHSSQGRLAFLG